MHKLGDFELHAVSDGTFKLDGGAMFGIVPKPVWERVMPADEKNRILLSLTCLLVKTGKKNVLIDTGLGEKHDPKFLELYAVDRTRNLKHRLAELRVRMEEIDYVILSHLHFDHAGGLTVRAMTGDLVPNFPNAQVLVQQGTWEEAIEPNPRTAGSYRRDDFAPLRIMGKVKLLQGDYEVVPGVWIRPTGGHVRHHQSVEIKSGGKTAFFWADLMPTTAHIKPAWTMGYDLFPHEVALLREKLLERAVKEEWVNVFEHDPDVAMGIIRKDEKGYKVETIEKATARG
jgi:glyoxylase-like metal-dependent hydrolase (beta-lactamase superfamily II)